MKKRKYFGTNGIRGVVGELINPNFITKMGLAIGAFLKNKGTIIVGADARLSSPFIKYGIISNLIASGLEVIDIGTVPTPLTQFAVKHFEANLGIMITASHNPPEFNGFKIISSDGIEIGKEDQLVIEKILEEEEFFYSKWNNIKEKTEIDIKDEYIEQILSLVDQDKIEKRNLKVIVDAANSVGGLVTPILLKKLGVQVITINGNLDGTFPGRGSEPIPDKLSVMAEAAKQTRANFAVAHDGDADRAIFGDEKGRVYWGDKSIAIFERWILSRIQNKKFVTPISSSKVISEIAKEVGGEIIWTPVGCIYVSRKMVETEAIVGGEENGGFFYKPHIPVRDGAMAAAMMANILVHEKKTLSDLIQELPQYVQKKSKIACPNKYKTRVMNNIIENIGPAKEIITIDGIKLIQEGGWMLVRPSGTEPIFRIFVESERKKEAENMMNIGEKLVKKAIKDIQKS